MWFRSILDHRVAVAECELDADGTPHALSISERSRVDSGWRPSDLDPTVEFVAVAGATDRRRREFAVGRWCARTALTTLGRSAVALPVGADRAPVWPAGITGSISHCATYCAAAVAPTDVISSLGIDVEAAYPLPDDVRDLVLVQSERDVSPELATVVFSAKESVFKAWSTTHPGGWLGFDDVTITLNGTGSFSAWFDAGRVEWQGRWLRTVDLVFTAVVASL